MFYVPRRSVMCILLVLWSLAAWAFHFFAAWTVSNADGLSVALWAVWGVGSTLISFFAVDVPGNPARAWLASIGIVLASSDFDLDVVHRDDHEVRAPESLLLSADYISVVRFLSCPAIHASAGRLQTRIAR